MGDSIEDIKAKVLREKSAQVKAERVADGVPAEEVADQIPAEWAMDAQRSAQALAAIMGGTIIGGQFDPVSGSFIGLSLKVKGEDVALTFNQTDDGQIVRFLPAIFDSKPVPLPPHLLERQRQMEQQGKR